MIIIPFFISEAKQSSSQKPPDSWTDKLAQDFSGGYQGSIGGEV
ncbi:hypothetical protein ACFL53_02455 [Pseudomonadota bacterium]